MMLETNEARARRAVNKKSEINVTVEAESNQSDDTLVHLC